MSKTDMVSEQDALVGRDTAIILDGVHAVNGSNYLQAAAGLTTAYFGLGCFWGAERLFWQQNGVVSTAVGYAGGYTANPSYEEVCTGLTGHTEAVKVVYDPSVISYQQLLACFFEQHDPTQGMRQGGDVGTQYRSMIFASNREQASLAMQAQQAYQKALQGEGLARAISTEIVDFEVFYYAELNHQQYLHKNPNGYCGLGGLGVCLPPWLQD
ncbi:peptide-methionine (S)-S-oxide reductase MsrA [Agarivorans sp. 1_MG-2023]|uniref:peptide-methionine (S)-S-oxide reductase MsrA n=1 Tax=Agarivorans sp. 1_MG-2023 TaxID=3062634 RepID=UPI0026E380FE|nr:peptide-methionine (S)-S-oxide reductase MsrA [Agarivorans sp. 1_MG-2023]MDO6765404.1 peptide-methionine (S)-S-oxide reductase MsrA [Agarivorans sp. 1_MG-2023]